MVSVSQDLFDDAVRLEEQDQKERALAVWRQLAEIWPTRNVFLRVASITQELGLIDEAEHALQRALQIDERSSVALMSLGFLAIRRRDYETTENYLKRACEIAEGPVGFTLLGVALRNTGRRLEADEAYRNAIRTDPNYEKAYYNLGALLRHDRPSEAHTLFRKALELDPDFAVAHREL
jgi:tetratricopeptide (TPR) repeat protein